MKTLIKYIELKTGYSDDGPAWIGKVEFSKSRKSFYFNDKCFLGNGHGYCTDIETNETYWVSGIKKNGHDRHWAGTGKIMIDQNVVEEYLEIINSESLDMNKFVLVDIKKTQKNRFNEIQNGNFSSVATSSKYHDLSEMNQNELRETIKYLKRKELYTNPNNGKKFLTMKIVEAEKILQNRISND